MIAAGRHGRRSALSPLFSILVLLCAAVLSAPAGRAAGAPVEVTGIRFGVHGARTRIVIDSDRRITPALELRREPSQLIVDLPEVDFQVREDPLGTPRGLATGHRYGKLEPGRSRIVIDMRVPVRVVSQRTLPPSRVSRYWRLVLDLEADLAEASRPLISPPRPAHREQVPPTPAPAGNEGKEVAAVQTRPDPAPVPRARPVPPRLPARRTVVIDPGHGGVDPGTVGVNGIPEKQLTLAMAEELRKALLASGRYIVHLTREDDRFIPLRERIRIARNYRADLFLSLHADSIDDRRVRGASVYTLSETASDAEAERLARKENRVDVLAGVDLSTQDEIVAGILIDLAQRDTNNKSITFAEALIDEIDEVAELLRRTRRYAGFAVLKSPDTPSVLLELGYLSNPRDAARLADPRYRQRLAHAIARAVDRYFENLRPPL